MRTIQILGTGCPSCQKLTANAEAAAAALGGGFTVEKVTDIDRITDFGVMMTPALAVDGAVKSSGKVLSVKEIQALLR